MQQLFGPQMDPFGKDATPFLFRKDDSLSHQAAKFLIDREFKRIWDSYPEPYKSVIDAQKPLKPITIRTVKSQIPSDVEFASHSDGTFSFQWEILLRLHLLQAAIVHEIAHYYIDARDGLSSSSYLIIPSDPIEIRQQVVARIGRVEREAEAIEADICEKLGIPVREGITKDRSGKP